MTGGSWGPGVRSWGATDGEVSALPAQSWADPPIHLRFLESLKSVGSLLWCLANIFPLIIMVVNNDQVGGLSHCFLALDPTICGPGFPARLDKVLCCMCINQLAIYSNLIIWSFYGSYRLKHRCCTQWGIWRRGTRTCQCWLQATRRGRPSRGWPRGEALCTPGEGSLKPFGQWPYDKAHLKEEASLSWVLWTSEFCKC